METGKRAVLRNSARRVSDTRTPCPPGTAAAAHQESLAETAPGNCKGKLQARQLLLRTLDNAHTM